MIGVPPRALSLNRTRNLSRYVSTAGEPENPILKGFKAGQAAPVVIPFDYSENEAKQRFESYQKSLWLAPTGLLKKKEARITSGFFPFWCFDTVLSLKYSTRLGFKVGNGEIKWQQIQTEGSVPKVQYSWQSEMMQIYASYKFRRDLADSLKIEGMPKGRTLERHEAIQQRVHTSKSAFSEIHSPDMRQGLAWELALRAIRKHQEGLIEEKVKEETRAHELKDLVLHLRILSRHAKMVYSPGFVLEYPFSESHADNGEIIPEWFTSLMSGSKFGGIRGERHFCPLKAQVVTTGVGTSFGLGAAAWEGATVGMETLTAPLTVETFFWTFMAASFAGLIARFGSKAGRRNHDMEMAKAEEVFFKEYSAAGGLWSTFDAYQDWIRCDLEWRHWEESGKWDWEEAKRRRWAEKLWKSQHKRRLLNVALQKGMEVERIERERDGRREARRRARWGESEREKIFSEAQKAWGRRSKSQRDFLGFYAILGLDPTDEATESDIKKAFRKAALKWHPDRRLPGGSGEEAEEIRNKFQTLQRAYEVLRDPALKRIYDRGDPLEL